MSPAVSGHSDSHGGSASDRIEVDPTALIRAGHRLLAIGNELGAIADAATPIFNSGIASGWDPAGFNFGLEYSDLAQPLAPALAAAANGAKALGLMLQASGYNYKHADEAATIRGAGPTGAVEQAPADTVAASIPTGPNGFGVLPPGNWRYVYPFVQFLGGLGLAWPLGDPTMMDLLAAQWENIGNGLGLFDDDIAAIKTVASMQTIPEGGKIQEKLSTLQTNLSNLTKNTKGLAQYIRDFSKEVRETQDAIRRILDRISVDGLIDTVTGIFTGEADDMLREAARDIVQLLQHWQSQIKALVGLLRQLKDLINDALTELQELVRPILVATFGEDVGNALATTFDYYTDFHVGLLNGLINTVAGTISMLDADTWKGMAQLAMQVAEDPTLIDDVMLNMGKEFIAWDAVTGENPARGIGEAAFNIGSLFVPYGGALSKTGTLAKGIGATRRMLERGDMPDLGDLPTTRTSSLGNLPESGPALPHVNDYSPAGIPDSVVAPNVPDNTGAPPIPRSVEGATGPSERGPGGDGPPPDPPGRNVGPPETHSPPDSGPTSVDPPRTSEPSTSSPSDAPPSQGDRTSQAAQPSSPPSQHATESSSPTADHNGGRPATDGDSSSLHGPSPTPDISSTPEPSSNGYVGAEDQARGHADAGDNTPTGHSPTHTPTPDQPGAHDSNVTDGGRTQDHPASASQSAMPVTPMGHMGGTHSPAASHTPGSTPAPASSPDRRPSPDSAIRHTDRTDRQTRPAEQSPTHTTGAAGPVPGRTPAPPVESTVSQSVPERVGEPLRPEPHTPRGDDDAHDDTSPTHSQPDEPTDAPPPEAHPDADGSPDSDDGSQGDEPDHTGPVGNPSDSREYGPHKLGEVEDPAYQQAVEDALRDADGNYRVHADPRTSDYGQLINDGGNTVPGRSNNCLDCSLSAMSSFRGDPAVSAPRWPDELEPGVLDEFSGEQGGLQRAADWLQREMLEFPGQSIADQFDSLHSYMDGLGPGSAALVHNGWHARDPDTGELLYHPDGSPETDGSHATVVVYPEGASGPVWWDPQQGFTSDHPPAWMTDSSTFLHFTPIEPDQGAHNGATGDQGTGTGVSGGDVADPDVSGSPVSPRMGGDHGPEPGTDRSGAGTGGGETRDRQANGDRLPVPELGGRDSGRDAHGVQEDGDRAGGKTDLSVPVEHHDPTDRGGRSDDRLPPDGDVSGRSAGADPATPPHHPEANVFNGSEGLAVESGDVSRGSGEPPEPGGVAGDGDNTGVGDGAHNGFTADRFIELEDGSQHRVWASNEHLRALESRYVAADAWLAERHLTRADVQPLLVQPADWLNAAQREIVYGFRHEFPDATGETLQKIIDEGQAEARTDDTPKTRPPGQTGGSVSVARDTHQLDNPARIYDGLALEYDGTPFSPENHAFAMRFTVDDGIPIHVPDQQLSDLTGHEPSHDPGYPYPFTGTGFTASDHFTVPEYFLQGGTPMNPGAEMYRISPDGGEELIFVLNADGEWIGVKTDG